MAGAGTNLQNLAQCEVPRAKKTGLFLATFPLRGNIRDNNEIAGSPLYSAPAIAPDGSRQIMSRRALGAEKDLD
jgi:hypothetical protein